MGQLRVTGGTLVRRRFRVPDKGVRPTSDRAREALFSSLGDALWGARVLDLFAGSGALGIEALSRGAEDALFVERDKRTASLLRQNLQDLGLLDAARLRPGDGRRLIARLPEAAFDLVFLDPPYADPVGPELLQEVRRVLAPGGQVVLERRARGDDGDLEGFEVLFDRTYGDARLRVLAKALEERP